jgi:hypothetical protein
MVSPAFFSPQIFHSGKSLRQKAKDIPNSSSGSKDGAGVEGMGNIEPLLSHGGASFPQYPPPYNKKSGLFLTRKQSSF